MAQLPPYTSTYTDVDGSIFDADDLVNEFWRVSEFMTLWAGSIEAIGQVDRYEAYVDVVTGELAEILPSSGLIQRLEVAAGVETFTVRIKPHEVGAPYRLYISIRCRSEDTRFQVEVPSGQSHIFGVNRTSYVFGGTSAPFMPSQVLGDGFYSAQLIVTFGSENGVMVQVMAGNPEESDVDFDDVLTVVPA
jgi:hypothetical protein